MNTFFLERLDDQNRFRGLEAHLDQASGQYKTHGYSYVYARNLLKQQGNVMGLDRQYWEILQAISIFASHNHIDKVKQKELWRAMRDDIKSRYNLDQSEFTELYCEARGK